MTLMIESPIPQQLEDLTPDWLTHALKEQGHLCDARVASVEIELLGEGEGFMGVVARLHLGYEGESGAAPATLIVKLPSGTDSNRMIAELVGAYWREIHFYRELTEEVPIPTPRHFYSALTADPMRPWLDTIMRVVDRMPGWFVDPMMAHAKGMMGRSEHRYLLLMEDLAPATPGDQLAGGTPETCEKVLKAAAKVHAGFWQNPILDPCFWLTDLSVTARIRHRMYCEARVAFLDQFGKRLGDFGRDVMEWHDRNGVRLQRTLHLETPRTLIHGDLRLDNIFFNESGADTQVIFADWQLMGRGPGAYDIAYLLSGALAEDISPSTEEALLRHYWDELEHNGVANYPFDRFLRDYWRGLMAVFQIHGTADTVDVGDGRGGELMELWLDRALARLRNARLDELL